MDDLKSNSKNKIKENNISPNFSKQKNYIFKCEKNDEGSRLDLFLYSKIKNNTKINIFSRNRIKTLIDQGHVTLNNQLIFNSALKVKYSNEFRLVIPPVSPAKLIPENIPLSVIFEDEDIIVINTPTGMVVHPAYGNKSNTLVNALLYHCNGSLSGVGGISRPGIVHRIDKDTSGIIVAAKNDFSHINLSSQFKNHSIKRYYLALVSGVPIMKKGKINEPIGRHKIHRKRMNVTKSGKKAITHWEVIKSFSNLASMIKCNLETGRTHQIRVHLAHIGYSVVGDKLYGSSRVKKINNINKNKLMISTLNSFPRQALHAYHLGFMHPRTNKLLEFNIKLPEDYKNLIDRLEN